MSEKWVETMRDNQRPTGKDGQKVGTMENERIAEKLCNPESYYEKWKGDRNYLKHKAERANDTKKTLWKQPYLYFSFCYWFYFS